MLSSVKILLRPVAALTIATGFFALTAKNAVDFDTWHQMTSARDILSGRYSLYSDPYTFTETIHPIVHHEWGTGLVADWLASRFGSGALLAVKYFLLAGAVLGAFVAGATGTGPWEDWALITIPAIPLISVGFMPALRAQMFTFFFLALLLAALKWDERGNRWWIAASLALFPIWVNLHGGCAMGVVFLMATTVERVVRRKRFWHLPLLAAAMFGLMAINPSKFAYYEFLLRHLPGNVPNIMEWDPMWKVLPVFAAFLLCVFTVAMRISQNGMRGIAGVTILLLTGILALRTVKMAPLFGLAWISYAPALMSGTRLQADIEKQNRKSPWRPALCWVALLGIFALLSVRGQWSVRVPGQPIESFAFPPYPVGAVDYLSQEKFSGNMMIPFEFGAYATWKLGPAAKVFMDSRYLEVYPVKTLDAVVQFYTAQSNWAEILSRYPIDVVIVPNATAVALLLPNSGWATVYSDPEYRVYARPGRMLPVIKQDTAVDGTLP